MNNDLISREALKNELDNIKQTGYAVKDKQPLFEYVELPDLIEVIDNALTVDFEKLGESLRCQIRAEYGSCDDCELSCPRNELIKLLDSERPTGRWIPINNKNGKTVAYKCSACERNPKYAIISDFCPNCGADMRGGRECLN